MIQEDVNFIRLPSPCLQSLHYSDYKCLLLLRPGPGGTVTSGNLPNNSVKWIYLLGRERSGKSCQPDQYARRIVHSGYDTAAPVVPTLEYYDRRKACWPGGEGQGLRAYRRGVSTPLERSGKSSQDGSFT